MIQKGICTLVRQYISSWLKSGIYAKPRSFRALFIRFFCSCFDSCSRLWASKISSTVTFFNGNTFSFSISCKVDTHSLIEHWSRIISIQQQSYNRYLSICVKRLLFLLKAQHFLLSLWKYPSGYHHTLDQREFFQWYFEVLY